MVTTFEQECWLHSNVWNPSMASLEYFDWFEEILKLDYGWFQMLCSYEVGWWQIIKGSIQHWCGMNMVSLWSTLSTWSLPWFNHLLSQCMLNKCFLHKILGQQEIGKLCCVKSQKGVGQNLLKNIIHNFHCLMWETMLIT